MNDSDMWLKQMSNVLFTVSKLLFRIECLKHLLRNYLALMCSVLPVNV